MFPRLFRRSIAAVLAVTAVAAIVIADEVLAQAGPIQITEGDTTTLQLDGNPSTGYSWVLQDEPRAYSQFVSVEVLGYSKPEPKPGERPLLGAPKKFQVLVTGTAAGRAVLVFNYVKAGTPAPAKTQQFTIEVLDRASGGGASGASEEDSRRDLFAKPDGDEQDGGGNDTDPE
jgi:predicted secreted protein